MLLYVIHKDGILTNVLCSINTDNGSRKMIDKILCDWNILTIFSQDIWHAVSTSYTTGSGKDGNLE